MPLSSQQELARSTAVRSGQVRGRRVALTLNGCLSCPFSVQSVVSLSGSSEVTFLSVRLSGVPGHFPGHLTCVSHFPECWVSAWLLATSHFRFQWRMPCHFSRVPGLFRVPVTSPFRAPVQSFVQQHFGQSAETAIWAMFSARLYIHQFLSDWLTDKRDFIITALWLVDQLLHHSGTGLHHPTKWV